jgi:hypothetical protein
MVSETGRPPCCSPDRLWSMAPKWVEVVVRQDFYVGVGGGSILPSPYTTPQAFDTPSLRL